MPTTDVEPSSIQNPKSAITNPLAPRVVKCPTPQCPGWITLDNTRHQTDPCRYCRIAVDTLRFLLSRVGAENKVLPPEVHDEFNRLMLTMAGAWGQNVYLRPSRETLVDLKSGARGVFVEYNPQLGAAGADGPAPLVGIILHKLLHFEAHLGHKPVQVIAKSGARDKEGLAPLMSYLMTITDHAWLAARLKELNPQLYNAQSRWGLDLAQMLVGAESMFNRYLSERNLNKLVAALEADRDPSKFLQAVLERLSTLTQQILEREKDETRKLYLAIQLTNVHLLNPDAYPAYLNALTASGLANAKESTPLAERLFNALTDSSFANPHQPIQPQAGSTTPETTDPAEYHSALEAAIKALGMGNYFDAKS